MTNERDEWLAYADTAEQVALTEAPSAAQAAKKIPLAAVPIVKTRRGDVEPAPSSDIREIPATLSHRDPRADEDSVPPLAVDTDLD
ncbi:MAG: hypothetical protein KC619_17040 [Myxococcales bacterium]|nr:hypothetical protein [Myxococcales bacterium]